jgi:hypothetical protein
MALSTLRNLLSTFQDVFLGGFDREVCHGWDGLGWLECIVRCTDRVFEVHGAREDEGEISADHSVVGRNLALARVLAVQGDSGERGHGVHSSWHMSS